jgi:hypothetical protein
MLGSLPMVTGHWGNCSTRSALAPVREHVSARADSLARELFATDVFERWVAELLRGRSS